MSIYILIALISCVSRFYYVEQPYCLLLRAVIELNQSRLTLDVLRFNSTRAVDGVNVYKE